MKALPEALRGGDDPSLAAAQLSQRLALIGLISFLTLVDLFAAQAVLPSLTRAYGVTPAEMGFAVNACTLGMAVSGVVVALLAAHIDRRRGIWVSLALLAIPTALIGTMPDLTSFMLLRIVQGIFMSSAFTLTMAYLAEQYDPSEIASALAAYITGNVACNLFGRLLAASMADSFGLNMTFFVFAGLNLLGALVALLALTRMNPVSPSRAKSLVEAWTVHFRNPQLRAAFLIGFVVLFSFIGTFTYVNFVIVREPIALSAMSLGFVYFVFLPSMLTTPFAGRAVDRYGSRKVFWSSFAVAGAGLPLLAVPSLLPVLAGLTLVACGTFFAQAAATGFVSRTATTDRGAASGIYLASYYVGGLAGSFVLGQIFDHYGWNATLIALGGVISAGALVSSRLTLAGKP